MCDRSNISKDPLKKGVQTLKKNVNSKKKLQISHNLHQINSHHAQSNFYTLKSAFRSPTQHDIKPIDTSDLPIQYFQNKYSHLGSRNNLQQQMELVQRCKIQQMQSLRIYRDELQLLSENCFIFYPSKFSLSTLKAKASHFSAFEESNLRVQKLHKEVLLQEEIMNQYSIFLTNSYGDQSNILSAGLIDIDKEEEIIVKNLEMETAHLLRELVLGQNRYDRQIRQIQEEILGLRIQIKQKEDQLRDLKTKLCTMSIKLHARNKQRSGSKKKDKSLSFSIKKFNNQSHNTLKQAFIGIASFKSYSRQIIQKVHSGEDLIKVVFYNQEPQKHSKLKSRNRFIFQCIYKTREGALHSDDNHEKMSIDEVTRDKTLQESSNRLQVWIKHLISLKFFYKSGIVGVQCRIKVLKGTKNLQIGCCDPNIEHELFILVNKELVTFGSFWHAKQMIGVSVWFKAKQKTSQEVSQRKSRAVSHGKKSNHRESKNYERVLEQYYIS